MRMSFEKLADVASGGLQRSIVDSVPSLKRGRVWCIACGHTETVNSAHALAHGWPKHCGATMTIDSPEERAKRQP